MEYEFSPLKLKEYYENDKWLKKRYGKDISEGMMKFLFALNSATYVYDIKTLPQFFLEHKKGNMKKYYSVSLDKKKSKWRLIIEMLNENDEVVFVSDNEKEFLKNIKKIRIKELSDHYGEY